MSYKQLAKHWAATAWLTMAAIGCDSGANDTATDAGPLPDAAISDGTTRPDAAPGRPDGAVSCPPPQTFEGLPTTGATIAGDTISEATGTDAWLERAIYIGETLETADGPVVFGQYRGGLRIGTHELEGDGFFGLWLDHDLNVRRLIRISDYKDLDVEYVLELEHGIALMVEVRNTLTLTFADPPIVLSADGDDDDVATGILWIDENGELVDSAVVRGIYMPSLTQASDGSLLLGGTMYEDVRLVGNNGWSLEATGDFEYPGQAILVRLSTDDDPSGWRTTGNAGSVMRMLAGDETTYAAGRFGGYGRLQMNLPGGFTLTSASSDDDPAMDAFVASVDTAQAKWVRRIRSYGDSSPIMAAQLEGDLIVAIASSGYEIKFDDANGDALVSLDSGDMLARYAPDGTLRWALPTTHRLRAMSVDACGLWALGIEYAAGEPQQLQRFDGTGAVIGTRDLGERGDYNSTRDFGRSYNSSWFRVITENTVDDSSITIQRLDW